ncbi:aspartate aminotransferase family protein [Paraliomyxa miuraensis]|uniref:aspartate aminotransferase family protein n=1 Tax=Paraliomyxa miuraensis TaxID=376150 RepID=UPI002251BE4D|nr:aspartate aminotransferase family protein [Paraliomyxa miuraensis]MCX4244299.1 aspartate aminotransferase family protein [Paraliomyxa miuraensis]
MQDRRWPTYPARNITLDAAVPPDDGGKGSIYVRDTDGKVYLDAMCGIGCLPLGHGHPGLADAIREQMMRLTAAAGTLYTEPQQALVNEIVERTPIANGRVFLGNTGTEVNEAAIKVALRATGRDVIIAFGRAFHGRTLGSIALTANPAYRQPYVSCIDEPDDRFARMNVVRAVDGELGSVEALLQRFEGRVAAVFVEPVQGEAGIYPCTREFLVGLRELCSRHGALLGADEIQCGSGRSGRFAAWSRLVGDDPELAPDLLWYAKALGGGFPVAVCVARGDLAEHMVKGSHGSTFGGNPVACAAALATLRIFEDEGSMASAGAQLETLQAIAAKEPHPRVVEVRGLGSMIGIEINGSGSTPAAGLDAILQEEGMLVTVCAGKTVRWLLPYRAGEAILRDAWSRLRRGLDRHG